MANNNPLDDFKKKIKGYISSHGSGVEYYLQTLDSHLSKHIGDGEKPKTLGDVLQPGGPLEGALKNAFESHMKRLGVSNDYVQNVLLNDLGVTIEELRQEFRGQLDNTYSSETITQIRQMAEQKLGQKLLSATMSELGTLEGTDHYNPALEHLLDTADIKDNYISLIHEKNLAHGDVTRSIQNDLYRSLLPKAKQRYQAERAQAKYKKAA